MYINTPLEVCITNYTCGIRMQRPLGHSPVSLTRFAATKSCATARDLTNNAIYVSFCVNLLIRTNTPPSDSQCCVTALCFYNKHMLLAENVKSRNIKPRYTRNTGVLLPCNNFF